MVVQVYQTSGLDAKEVGLFLPEATLLASFIAFFLADCKHALLDSRLCSNITKLLMISSMLALV